MPIREMIEHGNPVAVPNSLSQFPVNQSYAYEPEYEESVFSNIYIEDFEEEFTVSKINFLIHSVTLRNSTLL